MARETQTFSARWDAAVLERLQKRSELEGTNKSRLAERYVEEGIRMDEHPGVIFRDGQTGRRAALPGGPDVWEVMMTLKSGPHRGEKAILDAAEVLDLGDFEVRIAVHYYSAFPEDIDDRIAFNVDGADEAEAAWRREQASLV